jgi:hypothetical protein
MVAIAFGVARVLQPLCSRGVVHGNLRPGNMLLEERMLPVALGFRLAKEEERESGFRRQGRKRR